MCILNTRWLGTSGVLDVHLIFHLLTLNVLLYALQEVIGVKVFMSWRLPDKIQREQCKLKTNEKQP